MLNPLIALYLTQRSPSCGIGAASFSLSDGDATELLNLYGSRSRTASSCDKEAPVRSGGARGSKLDLDLRSEWPEDE